MGGPCEPKYNDAVEGFREREYPMINDSIYLDHAGTTLCSKSLMDAFAHEMTSTLYGNPHSGSSSSQRSTSRIEDARMNLLSFVGADPAEYDLVFVQNSTAGVKLVIEAMRAQPGGYSYAYHQESHTSLVGVREEAVENVCLDDAGIRSFLNGQELFKDSTQQPSATLISYPAQSHMNGKRYPLSWSKALKEKHSETVTRIFTLLDASSFAATSPLDLSRPDIAPDFTVLSLYKIFGFPDLGALIVRRSAESLFDFRKYFGGGTVGMVVVGKEDWHAPKAQFLHERLEDGTLPFHSIIALDMALKSHQRLFGSMDQVCSHTSYLTQRLLMGLRRLHHANGRPVCTLYTETTDDAEALGTGPVVSFNIRNSAGAWVSLAEFEKLAVLKRIHIRTGGLCSPGGIASALHLQPWEVRKNFSAGFRCGNENDIISGKPTGVIRASLGAMSTTSDVDRFVSFVQEFYLEIEVPPVQDNALHTHSRIPAGLRVKAITVFPIKSCGGFPVPIGVRWDIRPEGLAWDREWCLVHEGSGHALSQKRCPKMALLKPILDFDKGLLMVTYRGEQSSHLPSEVAIPLSANPSLLDTKFRQLRSRVCGEEISAQIYTNSEINQFFSRCLGIPCVLARFPPGGRGSSSRLSKAQIQRYQQTSNARTLPGSFPDLPSPPDSDSEQQQPGKILLSNESPILMIHSSSVDALNREIEHRGGNAVTEQAFRANIILEHSVGEKEHAAFSEDGWSSVRIGDQDFKLLGSCRRCQMVCIDQETGEKKEEPYITLAKTRRFDGKVYFGVHMRHDPNKFDHATTDSQHPTIQIDDPVSMEAMV
ncbi:hypothetical protein G7046_g642 [Stylonectria norvegica]|nr:hypothetical protein G7046_g642 [Stylonectria norvegica]